MTELHQLRREVAELRAGTRAANPGEAQASDGRADAASPGGMQASDARAQAASSSGVQAWPNTGATQP
eukprot:11173078-Lingulodinium_polyedra.AAC.1